MPAPKKKPAAKAATVSKKVLANAKPKLAAKDKFIASFDVPLTTDKVTLNALPSMLISLTHVQTNHVNPKAPQAIGAALYIGSGTEFIPVGAISAKLNHKGTFGPKMASELLTEIALILGKRTRWIKDKGENLRLRKK